jgi:hypothetical protein
MIKTKDLLILCVFVLIISSRSKAQKYIGASVGVGKVAMFDFVNYENYTTKYKFKNDLSFSLFFESKLDNVSCLRTEVQYERQNLDLEIRSGQGKSAFYQKSNYFYTNLRD